MNIIDKFTIRFFGIKYENIFIRYFFFFLNFICLKYFTKRFIKIIYIDLLPNGIFGQKPMIKNSLRYTNQRKIGNKIVDIK